MLNCRMVPLLLLAALPLGGCGDDPVAPELEVISPVLDFIPLPIRPEGIAMGKGTTFFAGSSSASADTTNHGMIIVGDLNSRTVTTLVPGVRGRATSGLAYDPRSNLLYAAETRGGTGRVYDATSGAVVQLYTFPVVPAPGNQINDVALGPDAAYFTNSFQPVMFRVALGANGAPASTYTTIPLSGDYVHSAGAKPFGINSNGLAVTADGKYVLLGNMGGNKGAASANCIASPMAPADSGCVSDILRVDPASGVATRINLGGTKVYFVDAVRLYGQTLYLAQNFLNKIAVFTLSADFLTGTFVKEITSPRFSIPSSLVVYQHSVFAVNAGFGQGPYQVSRVPK